VSTPVRSQTVLVVDPETDFLDWIQRQLQTPTTAVLATTNAERALALYDAHQPDLVICEAKLSPFSGLDLLVRLRQRDPNAMVILVSAFGTTQSVIESMKLGAYDFLRKESLPFNIKIVVDEALRTQAAMRAATAFDPRLTVEETRETLVGQSPAMQQVFKMVGRVSHSDAPVMITGESGSGKELVARAIHHYSPRSGRNLLALNCAAIPENLLESELFGHEKGAFTGAVAQRIGRFEQADKGTLFLDEIGDMPLMLQGKLLRVLQDGEFSRLGGNQAHHTDVRVIAATNRNLEQDVADRRFREDLFYRLNVVRIQLPPLRQRREDIPLLAEHFLQKIATRKHSPRLQLSEEGLEVLLGHDWPGNVRELENTLERAAVLVTGELLLAKDIPLGLTTPLLNNTPPADPTAFVTPGSGGTAADLDTAVRLLFGAATADPDFELLPWLERAFTLEAMRRTKGNQVHAAKLLGITRATLRKRVERFGFDRDAFRE